ncbi:MAG: hypothetical protein ACR2PK_13760, partial [Acidimicrobiales bacterium]
MADSTLNLPAAPQVRGRTLLVATWLAVAAVVMYFAGLFGVYFQRRAFFRGDNVEWIPESANIQLTAPGMIMWTLLLGCAVVQWAVYS